MGFQFFMYNISLIILYIDMSQDFLIYFFKDYKTLLGECIMAYVSCEGKKREILKSENKNYNADGELCKAYSEAQNNILMEIKYLSIISSLIKQILNGKINKTKKSKSTKTKVKELKGGKKKKKTTYKKNKIETTAIGSYDKIKLMIVLFLLISLKTFAESSDDSVTVAHKYTPSNYQFIYKTIPQPKPLDTLDEAQMREETMRFVDDMPPVNNSPLYSTNLTKQFFEISKSLHRFQFFEYTTMDFHKEVIDLVLNVYNNALYPTHELLNQVCDVFVDTLDDTNPEYLSDYLEALTEKNKDTYARNVAELGQSLAVSVESYAEEATGQKKTWADYWSDSFKSQPDINYTPPANQEDKNATRNELINRHSQEIPKIIAKYEEGYQKYLDNDVTNVARKGSSLAKRRKYLAGICAFSLNTCELKYNEHDGTLFFTDSPKRRSHINAIIDNVLMVNERNLNIDRVTDNTKQIEMAKFLQSILNKWDGALKKFMTTGHYGKKSLESYINGFKKEIMSLQNFTKLGLHGNPNELLEAHKQNDLSIGNQIIFDMQYEQDQRQFLNENRSRTVQSNSWNAYFDHYSNIVSRNVDGWVGYAGNFTFNTFYSILFLCVLGSVGFVVCTSLITYAFGMIPSMIFGGVRSTITGNKTREKIKSTTRKKHSPQLNEEEKRLKAISDKSKQAKEEMDKILGLK